MTDELKQALDAADRASLIAAVTYQYEGCICRGESDDAEILDLLNGA